MKTTLPDGSPLPATDVDRPEVLAELQAAFDRYECALVTNDVAVLDELFWQDPRTLRFGVAENLFGHEEIAAFRATRPATGMQRTILRQSLHTFGRDFGTASIEFVRESRPGMIGRQQQTWVRLGGAWRVVAAHVSFMETATP
jgi:hypothetical protein